MTEYLIQKTINIRLFTDGDGEFAVHRIVGLPCRLSYVRPETLRDAGFSVIRKTSPVEDPPGTVRRFRATDDTCIKDLAGRWRYLNTSTVSQEFVSAVDIEISFLEEG